MPCGLFGSSKNKFFIIFFTFRFPAPKRSAQKSILSEKPLYITRGCELFLPASLGLRSGPGRHETTVEESRGGRVSSVTDLPTVEESRGGQGSWVRSKAASSAQIPLAALQAG